MAITIQRSIAREVPVAPQCSSPVMAGARSTPNPLPLLQKRDPHEAMVRSVVDFAREIRVHLRNESIIFGSVKQAAERCDPTFRILPWGVKQPIEVRFADVTLATPVKQMGWKQHCAIATAQKAGVFATVRRTAK